MRVTPPDLELWLTDTVRAIAAAETRDVDISNKEPSTLAVPLPRALIVIRDDSGPRDGWTTFGRSVGASVLAGSRLNDQPAKDLARWLASILHDDGIVLLPGSPIASVRWDGCNGPYAIRDQLDVSRQYLTAQYIVGGSW